MRTILFTRSALVSGFAIAVALASALVFAGHDGPVASYTGCLNVNGGTFVGLRAGNTPLAPCGGNQIQVHLSGGDITSVAAGTGLQGGASNGPATLALQPTYRLPQTCSSGAVAKWTGSAWECGADADTDVSAIGGYSHVSPGSDGVPDDLATVGKLLLPAGKYAIFAKIHILGSADEDYWDVISVRCNLIAESDVDEGSIVLAGNGGDADDNLNGVIALTLLHEFAGEGFADVACEDSGSYPGVDFADARWTDLRITAIKLGSFQNVPLTR